jgi:hypothetical protein
MVSIQQAVTIANDFISHLYPSPLLDLTLEEVQRSEDDKYWLITLGFFRNKPISNLNTLQNLVGNQTERVYKVIKIDAESGNPISMQIRSL